jgi:AcrR family transcriptional regulator
MPRALKTSAADFSVKSIEPEGPAAQGRQRPQRSSKGRKALGRPSGSDGEVTRRRILDAAQRCFADQGYRETSNRIVAEAAGLTPGTIYHYFANKRDLFMTVHREIQQEIQQEVSTVVQSSTTFAEAMERLLESFLNLYMRHPIHSKFTAVVRTEALRNPDISSARADQDWRNLYHQLTDLGVASGEIQEADARAVRHVLSTIVLGIAQHGSEASQADHVECLRAMERLFQGRLFKPRVSAAGTTVGTSSSAAAETPRVRVAKAAKGTRGRP